MYLHHIRHLNASLQLCPTFLLCAQLSSSLLSSYYSTQKTIITLDLTFSEFVSFSTLRVSLTLGTLQTELKFDFMKNRNFDVQWIAGSYLLAV